MCLEVSALESNDYIRTLLEQIRCRKAHSLVKEEIESHIEDRKLQYESEGMAPEQAYQQAVSHMGDPVETGMLLDRVHRPKMPYGMLALAAVLTITGIIMQSVIFPQIGNGYISGSYLGKTIFYNLLGFGVIAGILFADYTFIGRRAIGLYVLYVAGIAAMSRIYFIFGLIHYPQQNVFSYYCTLFYPVVFAGLLYHFRKEALKGLAKCAGLSLLALLVLKWCYMLSFSGAVEAALGCLITATAAVMKNVICGVKGKLLAFLWIPAISIPSLVIADVLWTNGRLTILSGYQLMRIRAFLNPLDHSEGWGYMMLNARNAIKGFTLTGNGELPVKAVTQLYSDFIISSMFSYFGILAGTAVLLLTASFALRALHFSFRQKNRIGFLLGIACGSSMLIRMINYCLFNFGYGIWATTAMPFLTFGLGNTVVNAVFIGLILCVYRNTDVLPENCGGRFPSYRLRLVKIEK